MAALDTIAPEAVESLDRIGKADLVVAAPACLTADLLAAAAAGMDPVLSALIPNSKAVLLHPVTAVSNAPENSFQSAASSVLHMVAYPLSPVERYREQSLEQALRSLSQIGRMLGARGCVLLGSHAASRIPDDVRALSEPILNHGYDLAVPLYTRRRFSSLLNSGVVYPLVRAIYGIRVGFPMAVDLAFSARLAGQEGGASTTGSSSWVAVKAACAGLQICEVHRDYDLAPSTSEPNDLSATLAQVLGGFFVDIERNAMFWQKVRGSQPVRAFGDPRTVDEEKQSVDVHTMVETFQRGCRDLLDIWATVLSPATLVELRRIAKLPVDQFRLGDDFWAHALYDFILGHRQRVINREHLLRSLTPIYLGWVASYALEVQNAAPPAVEARLEKLYAVFESLKPYLLSRWRWPDRFNP